MRAWDETRIGEVLLGKYRLTRLIGRGASGAVYEAEHRGGRRYAIKILHHPAPEGTHNDTRFRREIYVANLVRHPGLVEIFDDDELDADTPLLVMELLEGRTLDELSLRSPGQTLAPSDVLACAWHTLDVLAAVHAQRIIHRDIKPENLFVTRDRRLKVLDYGVASVQELTRLTQAGTLWGTPEFMAPEQARGERDLDARSDVWNVGATMFVLLSGQPVHDVVGPPLVRCVAHATKPARSLAEVAPEMPAAVVALVDRALRFDRTERWESAAQMQDEVRAVFHALPTEARRSTLVEAPPRPPATDARRGANESGRPATVEEFAEHLAIRWPFFVSSSRIGKGLLPTFAKRLYEGEEWVAPRLGAYSDCTLLDGLHTLLEWHTLRCIEVGFTNTGITAVLDEIRYIQNSTSLTADGKRTFCFRLERLVLMLMVDKPKSAFHRSEVAHERLAELSEPVQAYLRDTIKMTEAPTS